MVSWDVVMEGTLILDVAEMSVGRNLREDRTGQGFRKNSHTTGIT